MCFDFIKDEIRHRREYVAREQKILQLQEQIISILEKEKGDTEGE